MLKNKTKKNVAAVKPNADRKEAPATRNHDTENLDKAVTVDRRKSSDRRKQEIPVALERRVKVARRRQIDPTTCERDYSVEELEFMNALELYKRTNGRMFPTCSEVLEVLRSLGYQKQPPQPEPAATVEVASALPAAPFDTPAAMPDPVAV